jgi:olfactory receptor
MHLITTLGNLLTILAICLDAHFHTSVYFFLSNLSFTLNSSTIPKMVVNFQAEGQDITYTGCIAQVWFVLVLVAWKIAS